MQADVRYGSDSAVAALFRDGSYTPKTGHRSGRLARQKSAMKRREQVQRNCQCASTSRQKTHQPKQTVRQDFDNV
jgi:hypothetical protein